MQHRAENRCKRVGQHSRPNRQPFDTARNAAAGSVPKSLKMQRFADEPHVLGIVAATWPNQSITLLEIWRTPPASFTGAIALNGVAVATAACQQRRVLTVVGMDGASAAIRRLARGTLSCGRWPRQLPVGKVNLEGAARRRPPNRHIVTSHVDGVGEVVKFEPVGRATELVIAPHDPGRLHRAQRPITVNA